MTAGRERSAGQASLAVAARDRVSLRVAGGRSQPSEGHSSPTYAGVDNGESNPVIVLLAEIAAALADRERGVRAKLRVVDGSGGG